MEISGFYKVTVKFENETVDERTGKEKTQKYKEVYIVEGCGDTQSAVKLVENALRDCTIEWVVESVKEEKINAVFRKQDV